MKKRIVMTVATISLLGSMGLPAIAETSDFNSDLLFRYNTSSPTTRMILTTGGNLGIGSTSPIHKLQVDGDFYINNGENSTIRSSAHTLSFKGTTDNGYAHRYYGFYPAAGSASITYSMIGLYKGNTDLSFLETIRLHANGSSYFNGGNIGIGLTTPEMPLDIQSNSNAESLQLRGRSADNISELWFANNDGTNKFVLQSRPNANYMEWKSNGQTGVILRTDSGNVGIGITNPLYKLDVQGTNSGIRIKSNSTNDSDTGNIYFTNTTSDEIHSQITAYRNTGVNGRLAFSTRQNGTVKETMRLDEKGNVGIGTPTPSATLAVRSINAIATIIAENTALPSDTYIQIKGRTSTGVVKTACFGLQNSTGYIGNGGNLNDGLFIDYAKVGIGTSSPAVKMEIKSSGNDRIVIGSSISDTNQNSPKLSFFGGGSGTTITGPSIQKINTNPYGRGRLAFFQHNGDNYTSENEVMSITYDGKVGIGTTNPAKTLHVVGATDMISGTFMLRSNDAMAMDKGGCIGFGGIYLNPNNDTGWASIGGLKENAIDGNYAGYLSFYTRDNGASNSEKMRIASNGYVGIGTPTPNAHLQIRGKASFDSDTRLHLTNGASNHGRTNFIITGRIDGGNDAWYFGSGARNSIVFATNSASAGNNIGSLGTEQFSLQLEGNSKSLGFLTRTKANVPVMTITQSGTIGIGTSSPQAPLHVIGKIIADEVSVPLSKWADDVFEPDYKLMPISEVQSFVNTNKHLPGVPSEKELQKQGLGLAKLQTIQMRKIEELTLYVIQQNNHIANQDKTIGQLKLEIKDIQSEKEQFKTRLDQLEAVIKTLTTKQK